MNRTTDQMRELFPHGNMSTPIVVREGVRIQTSGWPDALGIIKRRLWWRSMSNTEQVVATVLIGAGSLITRRKKS